MEVANNKYVSTAITIGLGLYAALLGPNLPKFVKDLFTNTLFRILVLFLVVVRGNKDPQMAIMIAVAFVLTLDYIYVRDAKETFQMIERMSDHEHKHKHECESKPDHVWRDGHCHHVHH